jgi:hypothetical protein
MTCRHDVGRRRDVGAQVDLLMAARLRLEMSETCQRRIILGRADRVAVHSLQPRAKVIARLAIMSNNKRNLNGPQAQK